MRARTQGRPARDEANCQAFCRAGGWEVFRRAKCLAVRLIARWAALRAGAHAVYPGSAPQPGGAGGMMDTSILSLAPKHEHPKSPGLYDRSVSACSDGR